MFLPDFRGGSLRHGVQTGRRMPESPHPAPLHFFAANFGLHAGQHFEQ
jgi:hypothetical protein